MEHMENRPETEGRPAIFFDRDGVVNRRLVGDYVKRWEEFELLPDILHVLPQAHAAGFLAVLVTNQQGIAKKLMSEADLSAIHRRMQRELEERTGHRFDAIYHCPHGKDEGCNCRKPQSGMLLQAAAEHGIGLSRSWMIGDSESDVVAGKNAGCRTIRIAPHGTETIADGVAGNLAEGWKLVCG